MEQKLFKPETVDDLVGWERNPRQITPKAMTALRKSMSRFGDLSGIVYNCRTRRLVCGHQRLAGLKVDNPELKYDAEQQSLVSATGEKWPIRLVDWDEQMEMVANIAANNPEIAGSFTEDVVEMIEEIERDAPDLWDELLLSEIDAWIGLKEEKKRGAASGPGDDADVDGMELQPYEHYDYVIVLADNIHDWDWIVEFLGLERVNSSAIPGQKKIGLGRAVRASRLIELIKKHGGQT